VSASTDVRKTLRQTLRKRDLRKEGIVERPDWAEATGGIAPRLLPIEGIGVGVTRRGRWSKVDPLSTPKFPSRWQVVGFGFFVGLVGTTGWVSWRRHGGLPDTWADGALGYLDETDLDSSAVDADTRPTFRERINDAMDVWEE
jgi:hypothetical protein